MPGPDVTVRYLADTTGVEQASGQVTGSFDRIKGAVAGLAGAFAAVKVADFLGDAVQAASNLNESASKVDVVFGDSASTIQNWSKTAATSMGVSRQEALDAAGAFGNMLTQVGLMPDQAADMSMSMSQLAADFAAFNNVDPTSVLEAQQAAFRGEYDALQKFVPTINAAAVQQRALADTGKTSADQLTASEKAMATYAIMTEQAGAAQGNFADTSDQLASQQRIASAQWKDLQATIGNALLPVMSALVGFVSDSLLPALEGMGEWISNNMDVIQAFGIGLAAVATVIMVALLPSLIAWAAAALAAAVSTFLLVAPLILIGVAVAALAYLIINNWDTIVAATSAAWDFVLGIIQGVWNWIASNWPLLLAILTGPIGIAVALIIKNWDTLTAAARAVWNAIVSAFQAVASFIASVFTSAVSGAVSAVVAVWDTLKSAASSAVQWIKDRFSDVASFFTSIPGKIGAALSGVYDAIISPFKKALDWLGEIPGKVKSIIDSIPGAGAISGIVGGLNPFSAAPPVIPTAPTGAFARGAVGVSAFMPTAGVFSGSGHGGAARRGRAGFGSPTHVTYELNVNVPPNFNPSEVGRNVVDAIRAFESSAGAGWRR